MKLVFIQAEDTNVCIDQALVLVPDEFDVDDLLDDERITEIIDAPAVVGVINVGGDTLMSLAPEIGENRPYFG